MAEDAEQVKQLLGEIRELEKRAHEPPPPVEAQVDVSATKGETVVTIRGRSSIIERDEDGRVKRLVGPGGAKTVIRNDQKQIVRVDEEIEEVSDE